MRDIAFDLDLFEQVMDYDVTYRLPSELAEDGAELSFNVECEGKPPSNIHVLIGKNGVGKTTILKRMLYAVEKKRIASILYWPWSPII